VKHSDYGQVALENFLYNIAGLKPTWSTDNIIEEQVAKIREQVGEDRVICALSGGVDSSVAAALVHKAVGDQLTCFFIDHGLLRAGEREQVEQDYAASMGIRVITIDESERFLTALAGVSDPEQKRKIIGREFIRSFEQAERKLIEEAGEDLAFELVEPLRTLFKDEVRAIGRQLGVPEKIVARQPFPGPGLGIRIVGEVTRENLETLRAADAIVREELTAAGQDEHIWQCPVVLLSGVRSVGVQGDGRTYGHPIVLRPVSSEDAMTADWSRLPYDLLAKISNRITNEVKDVNRVVLDVTSKPPGTIEWE